MARSIKALRLPLAATLSSTATVVVGRMTLMRLFIGVISGSVIFTGSIHTRRVEVKAGPVLLLLPSLASGRSQYLCRGIRELVEHRADFLVQSEGEQG